MCIRDSRTHEDINRLDWAALRLIVHAARGYAFMEAADVCEPARGIRVCGWAEPMQRLPPLALECDRHTVEAVGDLEAWNVLLIGRFQCVKRQDIRGRAGTRSSICNSPRWRQPVVAAGAEQLPKRVAMLARKERQSRPVSQCCDWNFARRALFSQLLRGGWIDGQLALELARRPRGGIC